MILDNYLSYVHKVYLSILAGGLWIYFRTDACYTMIPSHSIFPVLFVCTWIYANYKDPLFLPIGLSILLMYPFYKPLFYKNS
jgi:hypothetical protein